MSDHDRTIAAGQRILDDGCAACNGSKVYCRAVAYIEGATARCCNACSH